MPIFLKPRIWIKKFESCIIHSFIIYQSYSYFNIDKNNQLHYFFSLFKLFHFQENT